MATRAAMRAAIGVHQRKYDISHGYMTTAQLADQIDADTGLPDLVAALQDLANCAKAINVTQHAGGSVDAGAWSKLYAHEGRARAALAKAGAD